MGQDLLPARTSAQSSLVDGPAQTRAAAVAAIPGLWRGHDLAQDRPGIATGFASLDRELPGGGWPAGALTELLHAQTGCGEMRLLFPALGSLARAGSPIFLLEPPWTPYAPAFADGGIPPARLIVVRPRRAVDALWACEQILKGLSDGALIAWPRHLRTQDARRLQLAVEGKPVLAVLMRSFAVAADITPAALRIALEAGKHAAHPCGSTAESLTLRILKRRGGTLTRPIVLTPPSPLFGRPAPPAPEILIRHAVDRHSPEPVEPGLHPASA